MTEEDVVKISVEELDRFRKIISESDYLLPIPQSLPTFLEISGYPHFENVISNILQFFFDSSKDHEFSPVFIESLLSAAEYSEKLDFQNFETISVKREDSTDINNRIDLVIETDSFCIAIENKINAPLRYNDLDDYQSYIESKYSELEQIFLVLSLDDYSDSDLLERNKFNSVTYENFLTELESRMGKVVTNTDHKLLIYLTDLIKTLRNMTKSTRLSKNFIEFLEKNKDEVEQLNQYSFGKFKNELQEKVKIIEGQVDKAGHNFKKFHLTKPNHLEYVQGYKKIVEFDGAEIDLQIKLRVTPAGYSIEIWNGFESNLKKFRSFIENKLNKFPTRYGEGDSKLETNDHGFVIVEFDYEKAPNFVRDSVIGLMNKF